MFKNRNLRKEKDSGITLISLVVTIIVLLILASISISIVMGQNGLLKRAKDAKVYQKVAEYKDEIELYYSGWKIETEGNSRETPSQSNPTGIQNIDNESENVIYIDNDILKRIIRSVAGDPPRAISDEEIEKYQGPDYDIYVMNEEEQETAKAFLIENFENINSENVDEIWDNLYKDEGLMKEVIPSIKDEDLEKFVIQDGKLKYNPNKVTDSGERETLESIGIVAMEAVMLMVVALANEPVKIKMMPHRIKIPAHPYSLGYVPGGLGAWFYYDESGNYVAPSAGDSITLNKAILRGEL